MNFIHNKAKWALIILISLPFSNAFAEHISFDRFDEISQEENTVLLDIRTPEEYDSGKISGAINKNFYDSDFNDYVAKLDKNQQYIIYCRSGRRSGNAYPTFIEAGMTTYNFTPGIRGWTKEGRELVKEQTPPLK